MKKYLVWISFDAKVRYNDFTQRSEAIRTRHSVRQYLKQAFEGTMDRYGAFKGSCSRWRAAEHLSSRVTHSM